MILDMCLADQDAGADCGDELRAIGLERNVEDAAARPLETTNTLSIAKPLLLAVLVDHLVGPDDLLRDVSAGMSRRTSEV